MSCVIIQRTEQVLIELDINAIEEYVVIFRKLQALPLYNLVQNRISFMMYKLLNGFLPNIMSEICMVNNELHDHFTRVSFSTY